MDCYREPHNAVDISDIEESQCGQPSSSSGRDNQPTTIAPGVLRRLIERATERVLQGRSDVSLQDCDLILQLIRECCIGDIEKNELPYDISCEKDPDAVEDVNIVEETFLKANVKDLETDKDSSHVNNPSRYSKPQMKHAPSLRMDVPAAVLYSLRGAQCNLCWQPFKGPDCVKRLIDHTKERHSAKASPRLLRRVKQDNSYKKMLRKGIMYCTCSMCIRIGSARLDKRYDLARFMPSGGERKPTGKLSASTCESF